MMLPMVFDLDGVLVDTREANLKAYRAAGVQPPPNFHVMDWRRWTTAEAHDAKNAALERFAHEVRPLPLLALALRLDAPVLSNISIRALEVLQRFVSDVRRLNVRHEMDRAAKLRWLKVQPEPGTYFDDCELTCWAAQREAGWQACCVVTS